MANVQSPYGTNYATADPSTWNRTGNPVTYDPVASARALANTQQQAWDRTNQTQGGSIWTAINGPAPKGWVWNANGQPIKQSGWDTFDNAVTGAVMGSMTGGLVGAGMGAIGSFGGNAPKPAGYQMTNPNAPYGGGYSAPSYGAAGGAGGGSSPFGNFFDDPTTQPINTAWNQRMSQLNQAAPDYGDINSILSGYLKPDPRFNDALNTLQNAAKSGGAQNAYTGQYAAATQQRMKELNAEPFSTADEAALKARFFDSLALSRDDAYQQNAQQMAARGLAPSSGVAQALGAETSAGYQKARAGQQQAMLQYVTDERNRRRDEAVQMSSGLAARGGDDAALAQQWQSTRAGILGNVVQALQAERSMGMGAATTMASLRRQQYLDDQSRGDALLQTSALPNALATQRMAAMQSVLSGNDPFNQMMQMQQMMNQQDQINAQRTGAIWGAAGAIGGGVANKLPWDKWLGGGGGSSGGTNMSGGMGMGGFSGGGFGGGGFGGGGADYGSDYGMI